ncbi:aldose epimerase family protein [Metabacillus herbersteinensis]|uniref:Aldose 1-epimerase n=1 Tax=Metabacillus herbersteinensis TaxID=283816 RepID=A0ABV6GGF6_9BACI
MKVIQEKFAEKEGKTIDSFTLVNRNGIEISCINYGCTITKIIAPDRNRNYENIVLGYDTLDEYEKGTAYFGAVIGRVAGRIKGAAFDLDGITYHLPQNDNGNHLHGGFNGFDKVLWTAEAFENENEIGVKFTYTSPDGEAGYPGNVSLAITYTLNDQDELTINYHGQTDQKTLLTMTNHSYFNLSGNLKRDTLTHSLTLKSNAFLELDQELLPTGTILDVEGTEFDFRKGRLIQTGAESEHQQNVLAGKGYDHPFLLDANHSQEILLQDPESGRTLTIETDEVAVVVYSGTQLASDDKIYGVPSSKYLGICLETQGLPDAIHHPHLPFWILDKDKEYSSKTKYIFGLDNN